MQRIKELLPVFLCLIFQQASSQIMSEFFEDFDYSRDIRPVSNPLNPVVVNFSFMPVNIVKLDEYKNVIEISGWIKQEWMDDHFKWNPERFNGIYDMQVPASSIWTPKTVLYNGYGFQTLSHAAENTIATVTNLGEVTWYMLVNIKATCFVDMEYFPWDRHSCKLYFGPTGFTETDKVTMDIDENKEEVDMSEYIGNNVWNVIEFTQKIELSYHAAKVAYTSVALYELKLHRRDSASWLLVTYYVIPVFILSLLVPFLFLVPSGGCFTFGAGILVSMVISFFAMVANCPKAVVPSTPILHQYYLCLIIYTVVCLAFAVIIALLGNIEETAKEIHNPENKCLECLTKDFCISNEESNKEGMKKWRLIAAIMRAICFCLSVITLAVFTGATLLNRPW